MEILFTVDAGYNNIPVIRTGCKNIFSYFQGCSYNRHPLYLKFQSILAQLTKHPI